MSEVVRKTSWRGYKEGRETKFRSIYCQQLIDYMSKGLTYVGFAGSIGVGKTTIFAWEKQFPEWAKAKTIAQAKQEEALVRIGLAGVTGKLKNFNNTAWIFMMKNCCHWKDRQEIEHQGEFNHNLIMKHIKGESIE